MGLCSLPIFSLAAQVGGTLPPPSQGTIAYNRMFMDGLSNSDSHDSEFVRYGFVGTLDDPLIRNDKGQAVVDLNEYAFVSGDTPDTLNPSLWRQAQMLKQHGLFKINEQVYQVRGFDVANMTVVPKKTGFILIDRTEQHGSCYSAIYWLSFYLTGAGLWFWSREMSAG